MQTQSLAPRAEFPSVVGAQGVLDLNRRDFIWLVESVKTKTKTTVNLPMAISQRDYR